MSACEHRPRMGISPECTPRRGIQCGTLDVEGERKWYLMSLVMEECHDHKSWLRAAGKDIFPVRGIFFMGRSQGGEFVFVHDFPKRELRVTGRLLDLSAFPRSSTGAGSEIATSADLTNRYINLPATRFVGNLF